MSPQTSCPRCGATLYFIQYKRKGKPGNRVFPLIKACSNPDCNHKQHTIIESVPFYTVSIPVEGEVS